MAMRTVEGSKRNIIGAKKRGMRYFHSQIFSVKLLSVSTPTILLRNASLSDNFFSV
jgi:hypothetical protein